MCSQSVPALPSGSSQCVLSALASLPRHSAFPGILVARSVATLLSFRAGRSFPGYFWSPDGFPPVITYMRPVAVASKTYTGRPRMLTLATPPPCIYKQGQVAPLAVELIFIYPALVAFAQRVPLRVPPCCAEGTSTGTPMSWPRKVGGQLVSR